MAITYYFGDLISAISRLIPKSVESDLGPLICNLAVYEIWRKYDWRESLKVLPPFHLVPGEQDHGAPAVVIPTDFLGLRKAYFVRLNSDPVFRNDIRVLKDLELTFAYGPPSQICYQPAKSAFRIFPRVPINIGPPDYCIQGEYKKRPAKLTSTTVASTLLPFDDLYFLNMVEVAKWAAWTLAGDPRAKEQYIVAHLAIDAMAANEGLELGDVPMSPSEPLAVTSMTSGFTPFGIGARLFGF